MDLHHLTATEASERFRRRELSPVELLDAVLERTAAVEPTINAVTEQWIDEARAAALASEARFAAAAAGTGDGAPLGALEGIPLMLKDEQPIAGRLLEDGCLLERGNLAEETHPIVERIQAAGAVVHARTTTPEYCCAPVTHSKLWGVTRNPWNPDYTPGGSSGGSGAVLAAGATLLATGSDIGGSIRIPASFCGVVGYKPPFGRVPGMAPFNSDTYCADGPMGRSVADVALLQNVLAGPWVGDAASLREIAEVSGRVGSLDGVRVALCLELGGYDV
ncbi:amidase, partial [Agromyces mediolanus]